MNNNDRIAQARMLLETPLFVEIMNNLEAAAITKAVHAKPTDNELRAAMMAEVRAIRSLRGKLNALKGEANPSGKGAPA